MRLVVASIIIVLTAACCLPIPRNAVVQPKIQFQVRDTEGRPVKADILLAQWSNPHHRYHGYSTLSTGDLGVLQVEKKRKFEWVMPLMIHGVPFYYWTWCVQATGYAPAQGSTHENPPGKPIVVVLQAGDGACPPPSGSSNRLSPAVPPDD